MAAMLSSLSFLLTLNVFLMSFFSTILYIVLLISINLLFKKKKKKERDDIRKQDPTWPRLSTMNDEITKATSDHNRSQWREFVDHRTDRTKLWRAIKGIDGKSKQMAENEGCVVVYPLP